MALTNFKEKLDFSKAASLHPVWEQLYRKRFPGMIKMIDMSHPGIHQKRGIDRILVLSNAKTVTIDEKVRTEDFKDIALEFESVRKKGRGSKPGWVCNPDYDCDYIAYAIFPIGKAYLLPTKQLQLAWETNKEEWISKYRKDFHVSYTEDYGKYETRFCPVPADVLFEAIKYSHRFVFPPIGKEDLINIKPVRGIPK